MQMKVGKRYQFSESREFSAQKPASVAENFQFLRPPHYELHSSQHLALNWIRLWQRHEVLTQLEAIALPG